MKSPSVQSVERRESRDLLKSSTLPPLSAGETDVDYGAIFQFESGCRRYSAEEKYQHRDDGNQVSIAQALL